MKINSNIKNEIKFGYLKGGDIFKYDETIYIKRVGSNIATGCLSGFNHEISHHAIVTHFPDAELYLNKREVKND